MTKKILPLRKQNSFLLAVGCLAALALPTSSDAQVKLSELYLSAGDQIETVYLNRSQINLQSDANDFASTRNIAPSYGVSSVAVKAKAGQEGGLISMMVAEDGTRIVSDELWKAYPSPNGNEPPRDSNNLRWFHPNYDDSQWEAARVDGRYGIPPWKVNNKAVSGALTLDETMRVHNDDTIIIWKGSSLNANWIWHGNATYSVQHVYFRRTLRTNDHNTEVGPTQPWDMQVSNVKGKELTVNWERSYSPHAPVNYRVFINGILKKTVSGTSARVTGLSITKREHDYVYVEAVDSQGNTSLPTIFRTFHVPDDTVPTVPSEIIVAKAAPKDLILSWLPSRDNAELSYYRVNVANADYTVSGEATEARFRLDKIKAGTTINGSIKAVDVAGNESEAIPFSANIANSADGSTPQGALPNNVGGALLKPSFYVAGRTDHTATLRWKRATSRLGSARIELQKNGAFYRNVNLSAVWAGSVEVRNLEPGEQYRARLRFVAENGNTKISDWRNFKTISLPAYPPKHLIASLILPQTKNQHFSGALMDARESGCEVMVAYGNFGPQDKATEAQLQQFVDMADDVKADMPVYFVPSSHDVQEGLVDPVSSEPLEFSAGKFNRFKKVFNTGINGFRDYEDIRFLWSVQPTFGNRTGNVFLKNQFDILTKRNDIKHVFVLGVYQEFDWGWQRTAGNSGKPFISLDRSHNSNPSYTVEWEKGEGFVMACSQRNRADTADYQKIHIYSNAIYFEQRALDANTGLYKTKLIHRVLYDRNSGTLQPSMTRTVHAAGEFLGRGQQLHKAPWAINQYVELQGNQATDFTLKGRNPYSNALSFHIVRGPRKGTLSGSGANRTYTPNPGSSGGDEMLFQVSNGRKSQMGWVRFTR